MWLVMCLLKIVPQRLLLKRLAQAIQMRQIGAQEWNTHSLQFASGSTDSDASNDTFTPRLTIKSDGNVGIGTAAPEARLHVSQSSNPAVRLTRTSTDGQVLWFYRGSTASGNVIVKSTGMGLGGGTSENNIFIKTDGNVGIGTTAPAGLLSLANETRTLDVKLKTSPATGDMGVQFRAGSGDYLGLAAGGGTGIGIVIDDSNKVGIGTATPGSYWASADDLVIATTGNTGMTLVAGTTSSSSAIAFADGTGSSAYRGRIEYNHSSDKLMLGAGGTTPFAIKGDGNTSLPDNSKALFGTGDDLQIYHDGGNSYVSESGAGALVLQSNGTAIVLEKTDGENMILANTDGDVKLYYDGSEKLATTSAGVSIAGNFQMGGTNIINSGLAMYNLESFKLADNKKALFGSSNDLEIFYNGSHSYIKDVGSGMLILDTNGDRIRMQADGAEELANFNKNGSVELFYDNSSKFSTNSGGVTVTGTAILGGASFVDNATAYFGTGNDLRIYHDGNHSYISDVGTGGAKTKVRRFPRRKRI